MNVTTGKDGPWNIIAEIVSFPTNNVTTFRNMPKLANKHHYGGSEATETDYFHFEKEN